MESYGFARRSRHDIQAPGDWRLAPKPESSTSRGRIAKLMAVAVLLASVAPSRLLPAPRALAQTNIGIAFSITPNLFAAGQAASAVLTVSSTGLPSPVLQPGDTFRFGFSSSIGGLTSVVTPVMVNSSTLAATDFSAALGPANSVVITYNNPAGKTFGYGDTVSAKVNLTASAQTGSANVSFNSRFTRVVNGLSPYTTVTIVNFGIGPAGAQGPPGPEGPQGPQGPPAMNPLQVALLRWYQANTDPRFIPVGPTPLGMAFDGASMWVTNFGGNSASKVTASDGTVIGTFPVGSGPVGIAYDGLNIWVANQSDNTVIRVDPSTGMKSGQPFTTGNLPAQLAYDGNNMWVTNKGDNTVTRLFGNGLPNASFPVGHQPFGIAFDGANMWVANYGDNTVTKLRTSDGASLGTFPVGTNPYLIAFDGANIWVTNIGSGNVTKLRASDGASQGTFALGNGGSNPTGIAFDGVNMWVATGGGAVFKLRASDGTILATVGLGGTLQGLAFDGANMWVVMSQLNSVTKL